MAVVVDEGRHLSRGVHREVPRRTRDREVDRDQLEGESELTREHANLPTIGRAVDVEQLHAAPRIIASGGLDMQVFACIL